MNPREVIRFYQKQMLLKGWHPYASLVTGGGLLVFTKSHKSVLIMVSESNGNTTLAILVGVCPPVQDTRKCGMLPVSKIRQIPP